MNIGSHKIHITWEHESTQDGISDYDIDSAIKAYQDGTWWLETTHEQTEWLKTITNEYKKQNSIYPSMFFVSKLQYQVAETIVEQGCYNYDQSGIINELKSELVKI